MAPIDWSMAIVIPPKAADNIPVAKNQVKIFSSSNIFTQSQKILTLIDWS